MRFSITKLRKLLPVISSSELRSRCSNGSDAIWPAREMDMVNLPHHGIYLHYFEYFQGINITDYSHFDGYYDGPQLNFKKFFPNGLKKWPFKEKIYPRVGMKVGS